MARYPRALSRREFLRLCGVTLCGAALPWDAPAQRPATFHGRVFDAASIRAAPFAGAPVVRTAAADQVFVLHELEGDWARAEDGYVCLHDVQPIAPYTRPAVLAAMPTGGPFLAEVIAPFTTPRRWPAAAAPPCERVYYGAVFRIVHIETDDQGAVWYGCGGVWVQRLHMRPPDVSAIDPGADKTLYVDVARCRLAAVTDGATVLAAPVSPGSVEIDAARPESGVVSSRAAESPWLVQAAGRLSITGTNRHNRFGEPCEAQHWRSVTVPPAVGRWLYRWAEVNRTRVEVVCR
ncbi:MAG: hypothetical protein JXB47_16250 [Anaerolineae bacterium]|nr:hypothetical protein [Anaerolineae bacterium]